MAKQTKPGNLKMAVGKYPTRDVSRMIPFSSILEPQSVEEHKSANNISQAGRSILLLVVIHSPHCPVRDTTYIKGVGTRESVRVPCFTVTWLPFLG